MPLYLEKGETRTPAGVGCGRSKINRGRLMAASFTVDGGYACMDVPTLCNQKAKEKSSEFLF